MSSVLAASVAHHPAAMRNRLAILDALRETGVGELSGPALEVGSGTGAHLEVFAPAFPKLVWQPTEYLDRPSEPRTPGAVFDEATRELELIDRALSFDNVLPAAALDASLPFERWPPRVVDAEGKHCLVFCSNVCHISPWEVTCGLIAGASRALSREGCLLVYGPFKVDGVCTTESNADFDQSLRARNPEWGIRDLGALGAVAALHGMELRARREMPANNFLLQFVKAQQRQ